MQQSIIFEKYGYKFYFSHPPAGWYGISIIAKLCVNIEAPNRVTYFFFPIINGIVDWSRFETNKYFPIELQEYVTNKIKLLPFI